MPGSNAAHIGAKVGDMLVRPHILVVDALARLIDDRYARQSVLRPAEADAYVLAVHRQNSHGGVDGALRHFNALHGGAGRRDPVEVRRPEIRVNLNG